MNLRDLCLCHFKNSIAVNTKDFSVLVRIPSGTFEMGDDSDKYCRKHMVNLPEFWIGVYCVTNRQYLRFCKAANHHLPKNNRYGLPWLLDHPVTDVSWDDAVAYSEWVGLSLPTEAQWEMAARGTGGLIWPWGGGWDQNKCRNNRHRRSEWTSEVWNYPHGASCCGTFQQAGNVMEWCTDWYDDHYYAQSPGCMPTGPATGTQRVIRGGCWRDIDNSLFRGAHRCWDGHARLPYSQGFRLVKNLL